LLQAELCSAHVNIEDSVQHALFGLSRGNPFWLLKLSVCLEERIQANAIQVVDADFLDKLGLDTVEGLLELMFTRLKLHFLTSENNLYKVIAALLKQFGHTAFTAILAIREISFSQGVKERYVFDVFQALYRYDFLKCLNVKAPQQEPLYAVQSRFASEFLQFKTALVETDLSTDHKLMYLKKVIPLSVRSGDLDREKTIEVLSLAKAIGNDSIVPFLTETFKEAYQQETRPVVRVNIVNSLALINAEETREILYQAMRDSSALVREYAARNMALLFDVNQDPEAVSWVVQCVEQSVGDASESVRAEVYQVLYQYRFSADLTSLFLKGVSDVSSVVRLTALQGLSDSCHQSGLVLSVLLDAVQDPHADVRRYACIALQRLDLPEAIEAMSWLMQHDPEASIRSLAAELLHEVGGAEMVETMVSILETTAPEDVKISIVRSLGKQGGLQNELVFRGLLQSVNADEMPALAWTVIRALSNSASTQATLDLLKGLSQHLGNSILQSAIQTALRSIQPRVPQPQVRPSPVSTQVDESEDVDEKPPSFSGEAITAMPLSESSQPVEIPGSSEVSSPDQPEERDNPLPVERPVLPDAVQTVEVLFSQENKPKKERFLEHEIGEGKASDLGDANLEPGIEGVTGQKEEEFLPHERDLAFIEEQLLASARVSNTQFFQEMETLRFAPPPARNAMSTTRKK
jgi:HEAT repeat protein